MNTQKRLKIAIVAGEVSGDTLGAALIKDLKARYANIELVGIGGSQMIAEGLESLYPMDALSVMGLVEVLRHIKSLLAIRDGLLQHFQHDPPDLYIGIDAPDFNLRVAKLIKDHKLPTKTVQYVSPSVWAWRQKRVFAIKYAIDLVLCLFPFEVKFYQNHHVPAVFVGHPLARALPLDNHPNEAIQQLGLDTQQRYIALLPGSRQGEIERLLPILLEVAAQLQGDYRFLIPAINPQRATQIQQQLEQLPPTLQQTIQLIENRDTQANIGRLVMQASQTIVLASGTATLEALLLHRPMVVIYKLHWLTYWIASLLVKTKYYSLPNIIAGAPLVSELIQNDATPTKIVQQLRLLLNSPQGTAQQQALIELHQKLIADITIQNPADAVLGMLNLAN